MIIHKYPILKKFFAIVFILTISVACMDNLQDDVRLETLPIPEGIKVGQVELGASYTQNAYYNLDNNRVVKTGTIYDYDLAFESTPEGWHILLNSSRFMHAANSQSKNFEEVTSAAGLNMNFDPSSGSLDSTAIGNWLTINGNDTVFKQQVYVVDLGFDELGNTLGYKKVVFENLSNGTYTLRHADLDGSNDFKSQVEKVADVNLIGFTFDGGGSAVNIQAPNDNWHLFFGQYTTLLFAGEEPYPYLVRGVLRNRDGVQAGLYQGEKSFSDFDYQDALDMVFPNVVDGIGHDWKYYNLEAGFYAVESEKVYVIRNAAGEFYKMHFLSYFNEEGQTGYPQFEFKKLSN